MAKSGKRVSPPRASRAGSAFFRPGVPPAAPSPNLLSGLPSVTLDVTLAGGIGH